MNELVIGNEQTMTLKEITDLLKVRHNDAMSVVAKMVESPEFGMVTKVSYSYKMPNGGERDAETYALDKRQSIAVSAKLNTALLMRVIDRWQELESKAAQPKLPANYIEALQALIESEKGKQAALARIEADRPKVEFAMAVRNLDGSCMVREFAKVMGTGQNRMFEWLRGKGYLMANNQPYQEHIDRGLFVVVEGTPFTDSNGNAHPTFTTRITGKGQVALEKKLRDEQANQAKPPCAIASGQEGESLKGLAQQVIDRNRKRNGLVVLQGRGGHDRP